MELVPQGNVELHSRLVEAFNAREIDAFIERCDPRIELRSTFSTVGGATYRGHEGVRQWFLDLAEAWGREIRVEPEAYFEFGQRTLLFNALQGRGRHSGAEVAMPVAQVASWRDGLMHYFEGYAYRQDALNDLGVSENELEPVAP